MQEETHYLDDDYEEQDGRVFPEHWRLTFRGEMLVSIILALLLFPGIWAVAKLAEMVMYR